MYLIFTGASFDRYLFPSIFLLVFIALLTFLTVNQFLRLKYWIKLTGIVTAKGPARVYKGIVKYFYYVSYSFKGHNYEEKSVNDVDPGRIAVNDLIPIMVNPEKPEKFIIYEGKYGIYFFILIILGFIIFLLSLNFTVVFK